MGEFLTLLSAQEARRRLGAFDAVEAEEVALFEADGRVAAQDLTAPHDLPPWPRSVMDGYAVRARDTFGASEGVPAFLKVTGHVPMGEVWTGTLAPGQAVGISTGGVLPDGADAVVMVEYTQEGEGGELEVQKGVAPGDNMIRPGDDLAKGDPIARRGQRLRPQEVGVLSAFGITRVPVYRVPRVGVLSTGNEIVPPDQEPGPGKIRCMNQYTLGSQARRAGCHVVLGGIVRDDKDAILARTEALLSECDVVLLSGGSSVGVRDLTAQVLEELGAEILFHGISVRPGKPTILARLGRKPLLGMPGVPLSAMVIFDAFVRPLLWRLAGETDRDPWPARRAARLTRQMASVAGREDYLRVRLVDRDGSLWAEPLLGGSAMTSTLLRADGLVRVPANAEGVAEGEEVEVLLFG